METLSLTRQSRIMSLFLDQCDVHRLTHDTSCWFLCLALACIMPLMHGVLEQNCHLWTAAQSWHSKTSSQPWCKYSWRMATPRRCMCWVLFCIPKPSSDVSVYFTKKIWLGVDIPLHRCNDFAGHTRDSRSSFSPFWHSLCRLCKAAPNKAPGCLDFRTWYFWQSAIGNLRSQSCFRLSERQPSWFPVFK